MKKLSKITYFLLITLIASCSSDSTEDIIDQPKDPIGEITYTSHVKSIIDSKCVGCHANPPKNGAPSSFVNFTQVDGKSSGILKRMDGGTMPPSGRLPQETVDIIKEWIKQGKKEK